MVFAFFVCKANMRNIRKVLFVSYLLVFQCVIDEKMFREYQSDGAGQKVVFTKTMLLPQRR